MAKSRNKHRKTTTGRARPRHQAMSKVSAPDEGVDRHSPWYTMARGGKWLVVTAAAAAVTTASALVVNKLGDKVTQPAAPEGPPITVASVSLTPGVGGGSFALLQPIGLNPDQLRGLQKSGSQQEIHPDQFHRWIAEHRGVIADEEGTSVAEITLRGNHADQVRILDMQALPQCSPPLTGTLFYAPSGGEGASASIGFNLDQPFPTAKAYSQNAGFGHDYFPAKTISLNYKEQEVLAIYAKTRRYCEYRVRLKVLVGDKTSYETIGNGLIVGDKAPPFRFTAMSIKGGGEHIGEAGAFSNYGKLYAGGVANYICKPLGRWVETTSGSMPKTSDC
jgi:hypothetical protein